MLTLRLHFTWNQNRNRRLARFEVQKAVMAIWAWGPELFPGDFQSVGLLEVKVHADNGTLFDGKATSSRAGARLNSAAQRLRNAPLSR
jgi:hypothetical protein